jgi:peptidoglycan/xylan/chitin deacetylase (PgdA/CDA1 family)
MKRKPIPILITWDIDPSPKATEAERQLSVSTAIDLCQGLGMRPTFFITASKAHEYVDQIKRMQSLGYEIGCHGLYHTDEEDYNRMPQDMQRTYIAEATQKLTSVVGGPVVSFRSPRVKTSANTLRLLAENGYRADSSICSQRVDLVSSNLINPGWLIAPRRPYHPSHTSAFKRGDTPIWEVPISAMGLPFISGVLNVFGVRFTQALFRVLYSESRHTGKPIVYLAHPVEFAARSGPRPPRLKLSEFNPAHIRTHGFMIRRRLYKWDGQVWLEKTRKLFAYMASFPDVTFMTSSEYVNYLEHQA